MLTPIAGSILSVHAHAIGASHGPLVELDISDRVWFADGIGREANGALTKWIGREAKSNRRFHFEVRSKGAGYLRNPSAKDLHLKTTHTLSLPPPVLQVSRKNASS
jgi:hypothetical protein